MNLNPSNSLPDQKCTNRAVILAQNLSECERSSSSKQRTTLQCVLGLRSPIVGDVVPVQCLMQYDAWCYNNNAVVSCEAVVWAERVVLLLSLSSVPPSFWPLVQKPEPRVQKSSPSMCSV